MVRWRGRVAAGTFPTFFSHLWRLLAQIGKNPEEAVEWAKAAEDPYEILDAIQGYVLGLDPELRYKTKFNAYEAARSFFQHNRIMLPVDRTFQIRTDTPPVSRRISIENVRELIGLASQPLRSMLLVKWMSLTDNEGLIYINRHHAGTIVDGIRNNQEIIKLDMPGRKSIRNIRSYYTFLGKDAIQSLKEYFDRSKRWPKAGEALWLSELTGRPYTKSAFSQAWLALLRRAKLIPKEPGRRSSRYGYNVHNTRDLAISLLNTVPNLKEITIEFWAGHEIDPLQYKDLYNLQPQFAERQYQLAEPYLNILSSPQTAETEQVKGMKDEITELKLAVRMLQDASGLKANIPKQWVTTDQRQA